MTVDMLDARGARVSNHEIGGADVLIQDEACCPQLQGLLNVGRLAGAPAGVCRAEAAGVLPCTVLAHLFRSEPDRSPEVCF